MKTRKKPTHCKYGHPLKGDNLLTRKEGWINCKKCNDSNNYHFRITHGQPKDRYEDIRKLFNASKKHKLSGE